MRAALTVEENGARRRIGLDGPAIVGRDLGCEVLLTDSTVSRRHASLTPGEGAWLLGDLGSGNGTFLDGHRVGEAVLNGGETLRFGDVPARFETLPEVPLSASQAIQLTLTQTLSIKPARRARTKAAVVAILVTVAVLLLATIYHQHAARRAPSTASAPGHSSPAR